MRSRPIESFARYLAADLNTVASGNRPREKEPYESGPGQQRPPADGEKSQDYAQNGNQCNCEGRVRNSPLRNGPARDGGDAKKHQVQNGCGKLACKAGEGMPNIT